MGSSHSCGFGVLNNSNFSEINVGLSMGPTHYFENGIKQGEIFYCWPGAVFYTVYAVARAPDRRNDITRGAMTVMQGFPYCERTGCYGGGSGTWLVVEGGPKKNEQGDIIQNQLEIVIKNQRYVFQRGKLTADSHLSYHTRPGLSCTDGCNCNQ